MQPLQAVHTTIADVSHVQAQLRAAEVLRREVERRFGAELANELLDAASSHPALRDTRMPLADLRALVAGELLNRVGEVLVATADLAIEEQAVRAAVTEAQALPASAEHLDVEVGRRTNPETPVAIDRSEIRRSIG